MTFLWLLVAGTFPLFAVEFFRLNDDRVFRISFAAPTIAIWLILAVGMAMAMIEGNVIHRPLISGELGGPLFSVMFLFFIWHLISLIRAEDFKWGLREVIKLGMGMLAFWIVLAFFPRDRRLLARFWGIAFWASSLLMAYLIYTYAFVFVKPFLGINLDEPSRAGRNQLTWYLIFIIPCAMTRFMESRNKLINSIPILILTIAWLYAGSRGAWISVLGGIVTLLCILIKTHPLRGLKYSLAVMIAMSAAIIAAWWALMSIDIEALESSKRLLSLLDPDSVPDLESTAVRIELMDDALRDFADTPLSGIGLGNFVVKSENVSHNDYLAILAELGAIGFLLFVGILTVGVLPLFRSARKMDWVSLGSQASMISVIISLLLHQRLHEHDLLDLSRPDDRRR